MRHGSVMGHGQARDICGRDVARRSQHAISRPIAPCRELALLARAVLMLPGMTDTRVEGMLGLGWQQLRGRGPSRDAAGADAPLRPQRTRRRMRLRSGRRRASD